MTSHDAAVMVPILLVAMLGLALWRDLSAHRIDNWLTFSGAVLATMLHLFLSGSSGVLYALGGLAVGFLLLLPLYAYGGMAAGDVKLMAAAGAFLGPTDAALSVAASLLAGSVLAVCVLSLRGGTREGLGHIGQQLIGFSMTRVWVKAAPGSAASHRFPYALAIGCGCLAVMAWRLLYTSPGAIA